MGPGTQRADRGDVDPTAFFDRFIARVGQFARNLIDETPEPYDGSNFLVSWGDSDMEGAFLGSNCRKRSSTRSPIATGNDKTQPNRLA